MTERLINEVLKIIYKFSEIEDCSKKAMKEDIKHISIEVIKEERDSSIIVTHCSLKNIDFYNWIDELGKTIFQSISENDENSLIVLLKKANYAGELIFEFPQLQSNTITSESIHYPHLKEYLAVKIKHKLSRSDREKFVETIIKQLNEINEVFSYIKYSFYSGEMVFYNNYVEIDEIFNQCKVLSSVMSTIINNSSNFDFKSECCKLLNVKWPAEIANATTMKLFSLFQNNYNI